MPTQAQTEHDKHASSQRYRCPGCGWICTISEMHGDCGGEWSACPACDEWRDLDDWEPYNGPGGKRIYGGYVVTDVFVRDMDDESRDTEQGE